MKNPKIYKTYLFSNILFTLVIFLVVGAIVMPQFMLREKEEQLKQAEKLLNAHQEWIDSRVIESETFLYHVSQQPLFGELCRLRFPYTRQQLMMLQEFAMDFGLYRSSQSDFSDLFLFLTDSQLFLDHGNTGVNPEVFYNSRFDETKKTYEQWYSGALAKNDVQIETLQTNQSEAYVLYNGRNNLFGNNILFMAVFEENPHLRFLKESPLFPKSQLLVLDQNNNVIFDFGEQKHDKAFAGKMADVKNGQAVSINGTNYTAMKTSQQAIPLQYIWLISSEVLYRQANSTLLVLCMTGIALLLGFLGIAIFMAYENSRPMYKLLNKITKDETGNTEFSSDVLERISRQFEKAEFRNNLMQEQMQTHFELMKSIFFTKLLNGVAITQEEIVAVSKQLGDFFSHNQYSILLVDILPNALSENEVVKMLLKSVLRDMAQNDGVVIQTGANRFCVVLAATEGKQESIEALMKLLAQSMIENLKERLTCVAGNVCQLPEQLSREYQLSSYVLDTLLTDGIAYQNQIVWISDMKITRKGYYYPLFEEQSLLNCIVGKKYKEARDILDKVFKQNDSEQKISQKEQELFLNHICNTFFRMVRSSDAYSKPVEALVEDVVYQIRHVQKGDMALEALKGIVDYLEKNDEKAKENHGYTIFEEMKDTIAASFSDPDFSITKLSSQMDLSENYLAVIYRQYAGGSIAATIEKIRMEHAAMLLRDTQEYIKDVCEHSGYSNLNTFYKAFKRYYGVTPSDYRGLGEP